MFYEAQDPLFFDVAPAFAPFRVLILMLQMLDSQGNSHILLPTAGET
jgi:hypothetical protein